MTKEQKELVVKIFQENNNISKLWMNEKGEFFTSKDLAVNSQKKGKIETIDSTLIEGLNEKKTTVKETIPLIEQQTSIPQLEQQLLDEVDAKNRKSVIEAIEKRIEELKLVENGES